MNQVNFYDNIFDAPCLAPVSPRIFQPFPQAYLTGPVPDHLKSCTIAELTARLARVSEKEAAALVEFGSIWLDDRPCLEPEHKLHENRTFRINPPAYGPVKFYEADPARIVYEDRDLLAYNKESGRPSQGVPYDGYNNTLAALGRLLKQRGKAGHLWLLHRLDADTSGLLLLAKSKDAAGYMGRAFQTGQVSKEYLALGLGKSSTGGLVVDTPIAKEKGRYITKPKIEGLAAKTTFKAVAESAFPPGGSDMKTVLFRAYPHTGRTHQIRLHLAYAGWPIAGDRFYGLEKYLDHFSRLMLCSGGLSFTHPKTGREMSITLPFA